MKPTICWTCEKACGLCSWSDHWKHEPVPGWDATETNLKIYNRETGTMEYSTSYIVHACPEYAPDRRTRKAKPEYKTQRNEVRCSGMIRHISTSIDGLLAMSDYKLRKMCDCISDADGCHPTVSQLKKYLQAEKAAGHKLIRSDGCDNFDPVFGCLGHPNKTDGCQ